VKESRYRDQPKGNEGWCKFKKEKNEAKNEERERVIRNRGRKTESESQKLLWKRCQKKRPKEFDHGIDCCSSGIIAGLVDDVRVPENGNRNPKGKWAREKEQVIES
jgi:hypothetical protein